MAPSVWLPLETVVVFHGMVYGAAVTSAPRFWPSRVNWTPATVTLSLALAETVMVSETVAPEVGAVSETVGGMVSAATTAEAWFDGLLLLPAASCAVTR